MTHQHKNCVVKRKGHDQPFDDRKIYASVYAACRNAHRDEEQSETIAEQVSTKITTWLNNKTEVNSNDIFQEVIVSMKLFDREAAFVYETHRDVS